MKEVITIGGIALIGWALYEWLAGASSAAPAATSTTSTSSSTTPVVANPTAAQLVAAAAVGTSGTLNVYQWNYYWSQLTGQTTTFTPTNPTQLITAAAYLSLRSAAGLGAFMASSILADRRRQRLTLSGFQASTILRDRARVRLTN